YTLFIKYIVQIIYKRGSKKYRDAINLPLGKILALLIKGMSHNAQYGRATLPPLAPKLPTCLYSITNF
ncbi:hypothetical protein, partial [Enterobacter hormaechei]|uniref:hypothetical protein n=1 Tax=Enterobacter hormaechei TaxID=158836 RepID=UPI001ED9ADFE